MELERLLEPYIALGFDQNVIYEIKAPVIAAMGYLQSVEHLCRYGRPMYANSHAVGDYAEVFVF
jgi:hypothetical protein